MNEYIVLIGAVVLLLIVIGIAIAVSGSGESAARRAGRQGEAIAYYFIREILNEDDKLLMNVSVEVDNRENELDCVIINNRGVFIIEVKNYSGVLYGAEDDFEWMKYKQTAAGNVYQKTVKNPIKQVKRETYLLAQYLKQFGINVWVEGYALLINDNSPVKTDLVLETQADVIRAIHHGTNNNLTNKTKNEIVDLLS